MKQYENFEANGVAFRMVNVAGTGEGFFTMGSPEEEPGRFGNETQHPVKLSDFRIGEFTVTQALWNAVLGENKARFKGDKRPVETVSWFDAIVFCNALNDLLGLRPCYLNEKGAVFGRDEKKRWHLPNAGIVTWYNAPGSFRLPTEAQWEYAARGGPFAPSLQQPPERDYVYAGSDQLEQVGWFT